MRCFSRVMSESGCATRRLGAFGDKFAPTSSTNRAPIPTFGRQGRLPCLPCLLGIGRGRGRQGAAGGKQGRGRGAAGGTSSASFVDNQA